MTFTTNDWGFRCSWCGREVNKVHVPAGADSAVENPPYIGKCDSDGIVYLDPPNE